MEPEIPEPETSEPGPRLARTLAEQAEADRKRARRRRSAGIGILILGILVVGGAIWTKATSEDTTERKVGKLTASHLSGARAPASKDNTAVEGTSTDGRSTKTTTNAKKAVANWPGAVRGRPSAFGVDGSPPPASAGDLEDGFYLFFDFKGWHLWQVGGQGSDAKVEIVVDDLIPRADPVGGHPDITVSGNHLTFSRGSADAEVTGVEMNLGFYGRTVVVTTSGDLKLHTGKNAKVAADVYGMQHSTEYG